MNKLLLRLTRNRPMKQIDVGGKPYFQRYYLFTLFRRQFWLHRFLSGDGDRHFHNHPWNAISVMLTGGYQEARRGKGVFWCGSILSVNRIAVDTWHRIIAVQPGTWTLMIVGWRREPFWYFDDGAEYEPMPSSPRNWWKGLGVRGEEL